MRARSGCADCAIAARAACDARLIQLELEEDVPRHGLPLPASRRDATWGLADRGRSRSAARKTYHAHGLRTRRAMRRERRAVDAPCGRLVFSKRSQRKTGARLSGRTLRPNDDAVPPMEDIARTTAPACWPRLGGANRGSTDLNWVLMGAERVCRTFLRSVLY